jgi:hypothetical protein
LSTSIPSDSARSVSTGGWGGKGDQVGIDSQPNPASDSTANPYLASGYTGTTAANNFMEQTSKARSTKI